jgi:hypothetical protein
MDSLVAVPAIVCSAGLVRWGPQKTFLNICLPIVVLFPTYYRWKINRIPDLDTSICVMMPLGLALFYLFYKRWRFTRADLWLVIYIFTCCYADVKIGETSMAKYQLFDVIFQALVPYMAGKLLIEQIGARYETAKRLTLILFGSCFVAIPEFLIKNNLFTRIGSHIFPGQWPAWWTQTRGGFGRISGPYGTAEIYGMVLIIGVMLLLCIKKQSLLSRSFPPLSWLSSRQAVIFCSGILLLALYMTQSRGPWLGALLALPIALVGWAKRVGRAAIATTVLLVSIGAPAYVAFDHYSSGPRKNYGSEQETAQYRRDLLKNYIPLAERGGLWGWGTFYPTVGHQSSIDNEFLRVFVSQGYVGVCAYMLLIFEACYSLLRVGFTTEEKQERRFCFTMVGIFAGWAFTLCTVFMGSQSFQLFFILVGWTQAVPLALEQSKKAAKTVTVLELEKVYT